MVGNWFLTPSQPFRLYQGDKQMGRPTLTEVSLTKNVLSDGLQCTVDTKNRGRPSRWRTNKKNNKTNKKDQTRWPFPCNELIKFCGCNQIGDWSVLRFYGSLEPKELTNLRFAYNRNFPPCRRGTHAVYQYHWSCHHRSPCRISTVA